MNPPDLALTPGNLIFYILYRFFLQFTSNSLIK
jgi:hypothetical protein